MIVVEHDEDAILHADYVVDVGPGAGIHGGEIVAKGTPRGHHREPEPRSPATTSRASSRCRSRQSAASARQGAHAQARRRARQQPQGRDGRDPARPLHLHHRRLRRRQVDARRRHALQGGRQAPQRRATSTRRRSTRLEGLEHLDKVIDIDQSPIGRTPRSNPATYIGAFTPIREWFAGLPEAKARGYGPGRFSFNVKGGRCEACQGDGVIKIEMHFLPDVYVTCDVCKGKRYDRETLEVRYRERSIADVLDMTVEEGRDLFKAVPSIREKLETLCRVGLDYIHVGQQATTLSGGEAQRVKLSKELSKRATGRTLYILDEPTTGLHFHDVEKLLEVLHELVEPGQHGGGDRAQPRGHQDRRLGHRPRARRRRRRRRDRGAGHAGGGARRRRRATRGGSCARCWRGAGVARGARRGRRPSERFVGVVAEVFLVPAFLPKDISLPAKALFFGGASVSLHVHTGLVVFVGPNGSGKSGTLRSVRDRPRAIGAPPLRTGKWFISLRAVAAHLKHFALTPSDHII